MLSKELLRQLFAFGCVGVLATVVHYVVALFFTDFLLVSVFLSNILGYCAAVFVSIYGHSVFTYRTKLTSVIARRFIVVSLSTLAASEVILYSLTTLLLVHHRIALAIVVSTIPVFTFVINKCWVYAAHGGHSAPRSK